MTAPTPLPPKPQRLLLRVAAPICTFAAIAAGIAIMLLSDVAQREDRAFRDMTGRMVASVLAAHTSATAEQILDYANWNEAYYATSRRWNARWLSENFYSSVLDGMIVVRGGQIRHLWTADVLASRRGSISRDALEFARGYEGLDALAGAPSVAETAHAALVVSDGQLVVVAVAPITPEDDRERLAAAASGVSPDFLLGVRALDDAELSAIGAALNLEGFRFEVDAPEANPAEIVLPVSDFDERANAGFVWRDTCAGHLGLKQRVWLVVLCFLGLARAATWAAHALVQRGFKA